jgi:hypothetical protein
MPHTSHVQCPFCLFLYFYLVSIAYERETLDTGVDNQYCVCEAVTTCIVRQRDIFLLDNYTEFNAQLKCEAHPADSMVSLEWNAFYNWFYIQLMKCYKLEETDSTIDF